MVRVRNLVLAIAAATALTSKAFALGLGEVKLQSSLNQPLVAEIELLDSKGLGMAEIIPSLASVEDFNKVGVDRTYFLTDLKFEPVKRPDGRSVIRVTSSQPVREPYLNFLVEVMWPSGRLLREYTLLLDPPLYSPETAARVAPQIPVVQAPVPKAKPAPVVRAEPSRAPAAAGAITVRTPAPTAPASDAGDDGVYRVTSSDTLWDIAQRTRHGGSVHQAMLAIQELNPSAFVDGNINRMKTGQVLRLPNAEQVNRRSQAEAITEVAEQNAAWRQGRSVAAQAPVAGERQLDATRRGSASPAPTQRDQKDSLRLVGGDAGSATEGSEKGADAEGNVAALKDRLAMSEENLDSSRRENAELKERLEDLQAQLDKLQRLMQLKDDQLAQLQQQMAAGGDGQAKSAEAPSADAALDGQQPAVAAVPPSAGNAVATPPQASEPAAPAPAPASAPAPAPAPAAQSPAAVQPTVTPKPASKPAPVAVTPQQADEGLIGSLLANPLMLGVGGGALVLLLLGLLIQSRRKAAAADEFEDEHLAATDSVSAYAQDDSIDNAEVDLGALEADLQSSAPAQTSPAADILAEADTFIAYGRFTQAEQLLLTAVNQEPHRRDLRLKLLEVRGEMGDAEGFAREEAELREIGGSDADISRLKSRYPAMAAATLAAGAATASTFDDLNFDLPSEPAAAAEQAADDEFDFSLDDLESQLGGFSEAQEVSVTEQAAESDDFDLDFELPSDTQEDAGLPSEDPFADFALELKPEATPAPVEVKAPEAAEADFDFELDDLSSVGSDAKAKVVEPMDFDFSFEGESGASAVQELPDDFDLSLEDLGADDAAPSFAAQLGEMDAELEELAKHIDEPVVEQMAATEAPMATAETALPASDLDEDFDFLSGTDETTTKLDLARAYIEMGDSEGARDILDEILSEGNEAQQREAQEMLTALS